MQAFQDSMKPILVGRCQGQRGRHNQEAKGKRKKDLLNSWVYTGGREGKKGEVEGAQ